MVFSFLTLEAQGNFNFERINTDKGLSQSIVYEIDQDKYGNIWLATEEGVIRYNSKEAYLYDRYEGFPEKVKNRTYSVFVDSKENIWIGTQNGICLFNNKKNRFDLVSDLLNDESIYKIVEDKKGVIYFSVFNNLFKINKDKTSFTTEKIATNVIPESIIVLGNNLFYTSTKGAFILNTSNYISTRIENFPNIYKNISSIKLINNNIFIGTDSGQLYLTDSNFSFFKKVLETKNHVIKDIVRYRNNFYIGIDGDGIAVLDFNYTLIKQYRHDEDKPNSLTSDGVYDMFVDDQDLLWIATYGGGVNIVNPLKSDFKIIKHEINNTNSLSTNFCRSFLDVGNNIIWFGTKNGLSIWNRNTNTWTHKYSLNDQSNSNILLSMVLDGDYVWVGVYNDGVYKVNKNTFASVHYDTNEEGNHKIGVKKVFKVFKDNKGTIWVGGIEGKVSAIKKDGTVSIFEVTQIRDIFQDKDNNIICVGKEGAYSIDNYGHVTLINTLNNLKNKFDFVTINCGIQNSKGEYVLGTNGAGLLFYNPKTKKLDVIDKKYNLPSDIIQSIIEYVPNEYWITSTKGLSKLKFKNNKPEINFFNQSDGLSSNEFNYNALTKLKSGELIIGGVSGVTLFDPKKVKLQQNLPKIVFEELYVFNELVKPQDGVIENHINETDELELKYSQNSIGIKFAGILHGFSSKVKYSWMLEGFDENWSEPSFESQVNYTNLSYGDYTFKVKASNKDGKWGEVRTLNIKIRRPWYASILAYLIYVLIFIGLFYITIYFTKLLEIKKSKEEQINMLNNITHEIKTPLSILISSLENYETDGELKKKKLQPTIDRLNSLIKQMLNFHLVTSENYVPGNIDKILLEQYFKDIILDFKPLLDNKNLKIELEFDSNDNVLYFEKEDFDKIVFNLISNAIKYSFENNKIQINISSLNNNSTIIKVKDYGLGIPKDQQKYILNNYYRARNVANSKFSGSGLGLMIVKSLIDRNQGKISFESEEGLGTVFTVELPSQESSYATEMLSNRTDIEVTLEKETLEKYSNYKILVVEDNEELRKNLVKSLENYFLVYEAVNGKEALEYVNQIYPDLILTDYIMPVMDGIQMCGHLKEDINLNHIPVFMMTVLQNTKHKQESIETGVTEYLEKPININILLAKINNLFQWQQILKQRYVQQTEVVDAEKFKTQKDADFIEKLENIILEKIKDETITLSDICLKIGMSRTSLYMKLKSLIDVSPQDFIILTKLKYSKKMFIQGETNIKEVAYATGFANPKYFSTSFKKMFGITPSQYIKSLNQSSN